MFSLSPIVVLVIAPAVLVVLILRAYRKAKKYREWRENFYLDWTG